MKTNLDTADSSRSAWLRSPRALMLALSLLASTSARADPINFTPRISVSEEFNDNVFFTEDKESDFVTSISPGVGFDYEGERLQVNLAGTTSAAFFAKGSSSNRLADNQTGSLSIAYQPSSRWRFSLSDGLSHVSQTRTGTSISATGQPAPGEPTPGESFSNLVASDSVFTNSVQLGASYDLAPRWTASLSYGNGVSDFANPDALSIRNGVGGHLGYQWSPTLSFNGGYTYSAFNVNTGTDTATHSVNLGGGYRYSPQWYGSLSAGVYVNRPLESDDDPDGDSVSDQIGPTFALTLTREAERFSISASLSQQITTTAGIAGISETRGASLLASGTLAEKLTGSLGLSYANFNASETSLHGLQLAAALNYPFWRYAAVGLTYSFRWREAGDSVAGVEEGAVDGNIVFLSVTAWYPLWRGDI